MSHTSFFLTAFLVGTNLGLVQYVAGAKSIFEIQSTTKAVIVEIRLNSTVGSGVIINRQDNLYTLVTNRHVVCGDRSCTQLPTGENYNLRLADGQQLKVNAKAIKLVGNDLDLAIIQFRSSRNYSVAQLAARSSLKTGDIVYTAGFPFAEPGFFLGKGETIAVVNKRLKGDRGGYTVVYDAGTLPGMSGGGVFNSNGQLVAIHGVGDRFRENTDIDDNSRLNEKIGYNRGIPIQLLVTSLRKIGISLVDSASQLETPEVRPEISNTADEHFIAGFNEFLEPGSNVVAGKLQAIQKLSMSIRLNPQYASAYYARAYIYHQLQEFQLALADYAQAISLNPKLADAYNSRAILKSTKLNDFQGALADYTQAILVNPSYANAYYNRGVLKYYELNDVPGALADYTQAISVNPKLVEPYFNRAILKSNRLNDWKGALADYDQAISINPEFAKVYNNRGVLKYQNLNDIQGALADYNRLIELKPNFMEGYYNRGELFYFSGKKSLAVADFQKITALDNKGIYGLISDGVIQLEQGSIVAAINSFNRVTQINSEVSDVYKYRGIAYRKQGNNPAAIEDWRKAARSYKQRNQQKDYAMVRGWLKELGVTE
jgi:tetratricopeptide (TPR) repeat protein